MTMRLEFRICALLVSIFLIFGYGGPTWAQDDFGKVGMDARAYLVECEKGVEFWCSNQIYTVAIQMTLEQAQGAPAVYCMPKKGSGTSAQRNDKVVAAVKGWFEQHPEELENKSDASVPIRKAILALWPGPCPE